MVMQAEHIPVHLGAMPAAVRAVADAREDGDERPWIVNDPYAGGTHLPDITVVTPVGDLGFAASRAHHADVGGPTPGSMPADSTTLEDEGVVISPRPLDDDAIDELVAQMRNPDQRRADLRAQLAANRTGADAPARAGGQGRRRRAAGGDGRGPGLRGAPHARLHRLPRRRPFTRRATSSRPTRRTSSCASRRPSTATS